MCSMTNNLLIMSVELLGKCRKICGMKRLFFLIKLSEWKDSADTKLQIFCVLEIDIQFYF